MDRHSPEEQNIPQQTQDKIGHGGDTPDFELGKLDKSDELRLVKELQSRDAVPDALVGRTQIEDAADTLARTNGPIITDTLPTTEATEKPTKKKSLGIKLGAGVAGLLIAGGAAFGVTQLNNGDSNNTPPEKNPNDNSQVNEEPAPVEEEPVEKPENETPAEILEVLNNPNRVSPEEIAAMTPEELKDFATITPEEAPTPEAYAEQVITVLDAWMMAGTTQEEWQPYESEGYNSYENAMGEKYDQTFIDSLFLDGVSISAFQDLHRYNLNTSFGAYSLDPTRPYDAGIAFENSEFIGENNTIFGIKASVKFADNYEQTGANDVVARSNKFETVTYHLSAIKSDSGYGLSDISIVE